MTKDENQSANLKRSFITADMAAFGVVFAGLVLLPLVTFAPFGVAPDVSKMFFLFGILVVAVTLWLVGRLQEGEIKLPWAITSAAALTLPLVFIVSALFADNRRHALVGALYDKGTALSMLALVTLFFLVSMLFDNRQRIFNFYLAVMTAGLAAAAYYLFILFVGGGVFPAILSYLPQTLISQWYEVSVFFGFITIVSLTMLELPALAENKFLTRLSIAALIGSLIMLGLTNFTLVWVVVGLVALLIFVYGIAASAMEKDEAVGPGLSFFEGKKIFRSSFFVILVALLFLVLGRPGGLLSDYINSAYNRLNFSFVEVRPGWVATFDVAKSVLKEDPIFGPGPGNFQNAWAAHKPSVVNQLDFWNLNFLEAVGTIPTLAITTGIVGILAWLFLFGSLLYVLIRSARRLPADPMTKLLFSLTAVGLIYFLVMTVDYTASSVGLPFLFAMGGLLVGFGGSIKTLEMRVFRLYGSPRTYFAILLVVVLLVISMITGGYLLVQKFWSLVVYGNALEAAAVGDLQGADNLMVRAISLNGSDPAFYRSFSGLKLRELQTVLSNSELSPEEARPLLENTIGIAIASAQAANNLDSKNYVNTVTLGNVYEALASIGIEGAYEEAHRIYLEIQKNNPKNPEILLSLARLEIAKENFNGARDLLEQALTLKSNYTSPILLLAQLDLESIGTEAAIKRLEKAAAVMPNDPDIFFQLGFLRYRAGDYQNSATAMARVMALSPNGINANASYFLGLSYAALGENTKALEQFQTILSFNPGNKEVEQIIANIRAGRAALAGLSAETTPVEDEADEAGEAETDTAEEAGE